MQQICDDLRAEHEDLEGILTGLDKDQWQIITPFYDWTVKNEIEHLAYFDDRACLAATDPDVFQRHLAEDIRPKLDGIVGHAQEIIGSRSIQELLDWWMAERRRMLAELEKHDPKDRLPWYGPPMSGVKRIQAHITGDPSCTANARNNSNFIQVPTLPLFQPLEGADEGS